MYVGTYKTISLGLYSKSDCLPLKFAHKQHSTCISRYNNFRDDERCYRYIFSYPYTNK